jgi:aspartyl-tRNA(Asn)/glutamyl-tRNA(Gln) amidotransferase subunit A
VSVATPKDQASRGMRTAHHYSSIKELSKSIREQTFSPVEIVEACLQRIEDLNPKLNTFITVLAAQALAQAKTAEAEIKAGTWRGPLHGIPVGIKDFYDTAGIKTTAAFEHFKDRVPPRDAVSVAKLKDAGAIIIGKTNLHQLGAGTTSLVSYYGAVHNPWNMDYIAGGSSGGSAAAVASGMCYATLDTDAIGSCRLPASCCGVVGFKPTYGLINSKGILEGEKADEAIKWLAHPGITTRGVEDTALLVDVLAEQNRKANGVDYLAPLDNDKKFRIGVGNKFKADNEVSRGFEKAIETLRELGHPMSDAPAAFENPGFDIHNIEADRKAVSGRFFTDIDLLALPTTTTATPTVKDASANPLALSADNTFFANYYGLPAISIPCGFDTHGLPLGLQIVGKPWDEPGVLRLAYQYQKATQWSARRPNL